MKTQIKNFLDHQTSLKESSKRNYRFKLLKLAEFLNFKSEVNEKDILSFLNSKQFKNFKIPTQNLYKNVIRQFMKFLGLNYELIKTVRMDQEFIRLEDLPTKADITIFLEHMTRAMDKCLVMFFLEGLRLNEARNLRLKDIVNKQTHMIVYITVSKSKKRPVPVVNSMPFVVDWLNQHPDKTNPEQFLFVHRQNGVLKPYSCRGLQIILDRNNNISKKIYPHLLRHTAATRDYGKLSEKEMMMKYGWKTRSMIDKYAHLVNTDLEDKILQLHGIKPTPKQEEGITLIENRTCPRCHFENPGPNIFCSRCGSTLDVKTILKAQEHIQLGKKELSREELFELFMDWLKEK